jgi:NAD(P)-dependent dehydrogenase (short-subunit alcohol dehydrogenase family)
MSRRVVMANGRGAKPHQVQSAALLWYQRAMATILITGANRGIGLELCRQAHARGSGGNDGGNGSGNDRLIAACRESSPELDALAQSGVRVETGVDVTSDSSVAALAERLGDIRLDVLINNAGLLVPTTLDHLDFEAMRRQYEVNSLGPLRVTAALLPRLGPGSKVVIISSRAGSIGDNTSGSLYGYRMSKAAVNMAGVSLARDLKPRGIAVGILHPGYVRTAMTGHQGLIEASESAAGLLARIDELTLETTGSFVHASGERLPW